MSSKQKEASLNMSDLKVFSEPLRNRMSWEVEIMEALVLELNITNSDAQGIVDSHPFEIAQEWSKGSTGPESAARFITSQ